MKLPPKKTGGEPPSGPITASTYLERCIAHIRAHGGEGFVVRREMPAQWAAWLAYFGRKGMPTAFMRSHGLSTVPCEWPEDFDHDAPSSDRRPRSEPQREPMTHAQWEAVRDGLRALTRKAAVTAPPKADLFPLAGLKPALTEERLAELAASPVTLSPEARAPKKDDSEQPTEG